MKEEKIQLGTGSIKLEISTKYGNFGAKSKKTGKLLPTYQDCTETWMPPLSKRTGSLITGLTKKQEAFFEEELGFEEGTLKKTSKYWDSFKIKIPAEGVLLQLDDALGYLKYVVLKADPLVASSQSDLKENPYCEYVMIRENEKAENESKGRRVKIRSFGILDSLTYQDFQDIYLLKNASDPSDLDHSIVRNDVEKYAENFPDQFVNLFDDPLFKDKVVITKFIHKKIISKKGRGLNSPLYFNDTFLGNNVEECMLFLKQPENNSIFIEIMKANKKVSFGGQSYSLSDQINTFEKKKVVAEEKEEILTEKEKLELEVERLKNELSKRKEVDKINLKKEEVKHPKDVITEEMDTSNIEVDEETGFSVETSKAASTVSEVEEEIIQNPAPKRGRPKKQ